MTHLGPSANAKLADALTKDNPNLSKYKRRMPDFVTGDSNLSKYERRTHDFVAKGPNLSEYERRA